MPFTYNVQCTVIWDAVLACAVLVCVLSR